jgi:hypothetical protein
MVEVTLTVLTRDHSGKLRPCMRELTSKPCYYITTTSTLCLAVIVYFLSKTKNVLETSYRQWYKRSQTTVQKRVSTINLRN